MSKLHLLLASLCVAASPAFAQDQPTFATIAAPTRPPLAACPIAEYPNPPGQPAGAPPFFNFNGIYKDAQGAAIAGFACAMIGPFHLNGKPWYLQNVRGLITAGQPADSKMRTNSVRICSEDAKKRMAQAEKRPPDPKTGEPNYPTILGPFAAQIGPAGCERMWKEDYTLP